MSREFLARLVLLLWFPLLTCPLNRVFHDSVNSVQDGRDALIAAQIAFPLIFRQVGSAGWNEYARERAVSDLVGEEELKEAELEKVKSENEADEEIDIVRFNGLDRELYQSQYSTAVLDGTLTVMEKANYTYTQRSKRHFKAQRRAPAYSRALILMSMPCCWTVYLRTGGGMVIPCMLASIPMGSFLWFDDVFGDSFSSKFSGAFRVNEKRQLSVHDAQPLMSGVYRCNGSHEGYSARNDIHLYVYRLADPGLILTVIFRTGNCDEAQNAFLLRGILGHFCENESLEACTDEIVPYCHIEAEVNSKLRGRLELYLFRYDTECENDDTGSCAAGQRIARILENPPFKDLRNQILRYITEKDRKSDNHSSDYLFDSVRTLAEGYYTKRQTYRCPSGFAIRHVDDKPVCLPCFAGTSKASRGRDTVCKDCRIGAFASSAGQQYCDSCPQQLGTIAQRKGNKRPDQCFKYKHKSKTENLLDGFDADEQTNRKKHQMGIVFQMSVAIFVIIFVIVAVIGGIFCCRPKRLQKKQQQQQKRVRQPQEEMERTEKQPLVVEDVPLVVTIPKTTHIISHEILDSRTEKILPMIKARRDKDREEDEGLTAKAKKSKAPEEDMLITTKVKKLNFTGKNKILSARAKISKVTEKNKFVATKEKKSRTTEEKNFSSEDKTDIARESKRKQRSATSKRDEAKKTLRTGTPSTSGLATSVHSASQIIAQPVYTPQNVSRTGKPSQIV